VSHSKEGMASNWDQGNTHLPLHFRCISWRNAATDFSFAGMTFDCWLTSLAAFGNGLPISIASTVWAPWCLPHSQLTLLLQLRMTFMLGLECDYPRGNDQGRNRYRQVNASHHRHHPHEFTAPNFATTA